MNKFIQAVKTLDLPAVKEMLEKDGQWILWAEDDGKNALHFLCGVPVNGNAERSATSLSILKLLMKKGMNINAIHRVPDPGCGFFPATPLWYAYTRGRNETLFRYLLKNGANPEHCMFAIAWYDDPESAALFKKHGAGIDDGTGGETPFLAAFNWKKYKVAEWFLQNGADVNFRDRKGNTALYYAVKRKLKTEQISFLLKYGANADVENNDGISPRVLAQTYRQMKIWKLFQ